MQPIVTFSSSNDSRQINLIRFPPSGVRRHVITWVCFRCNRITHASIMPVILLLFESLHDFCPMLGAGSSSGVELFQVFMGTRLWQDGADQQVFHGLFIPTFARCLSILVESLFLHKGFASSSPYPEAI